MEYVDKIIGYVDGFKDSISDYVKSYENSSPIDKLTYNISKLDKPKDEYNVKSEYEKPIEFPKLPTPTPISTAVIPIKQHDLFKTENEDSGNKTVLVGGKSRDISSVIPNRYTTSSDILDKSIEKDMNFEDYSGSIDHDIYIKESQELKKQNPRTISYEKGYQAGVTMSKVKLCLGIAIGFGLFYLAYYLIVILGWWI